MQFLFLSCLVTELKVPAASNLMCRVPRLAEILSFLVFDPFADLFIMLCIVVNTAFMALDQHDMDPGMDNALKNGNYVSIICLMYTSLFSLFLW